MALSRDDVFGVNRDLPLNYVERENVDERFVSSLSRRQHIVIYGSSKQGKTSLRKNSLMEDDCVVVSASNKWSLAQLHGAILKKCGYQVEVSSKKGISGSAKLSASAKFKGGVPLLASGGAGLSLDGSGGMSKEIELRSLELDPDDVNDVIRALDELSFTKYIILEDFHYLPEETQKDFSIALKAFHENSEYVFIVVGVWREKNRLIGYNGDLTDRVISIDADTWSDGQLQSVIHKGAALLNIEFDPKFVDECVANCFGSVHLVQEACRRACEAEGVVHPEASKRIIGAECDAARVVREIVDDQSGRYLGFLQNIQEGFQETKKEMPKWVVYSILKADPAQLDQGLKLSVISKIMKSAHPDGQGLNPGNITQALKSFASLQVKHNIRPIIADYDNQNRRLHIVDRGFEIWLAHQDRSELLEELALE